MPGRAECDSKPTEKPTETRRGLPPALAHAGPCGNPSPSLWRHSLWRHKALLWRQPPWRRRRWIPNRPGFAPYK